MKKVAYIISHGHTARGLFQTGLLNELIKEGLEVHVIATERDASEVKTKSLAAGAKFHNYAFKETKSGFFSEWLRIYVLEDVKKNPALWEKHLRRVNDHLSSPIKRIIARLFLILSYITNFIPVLKKLYLQIERRSNKDQNAEEILKAIQPDLIVSTRPVVLAEAYLLGAARRLKIPRLLNILSWDNITSKGYFREQGEYYLSWGSIMTQELEEYYQVKRENITECGVAHFDLHFEQREERKVEFWLNKLKLDPSKPFIFFTMSAPYFCPDEILIIEWLASQVESNKYGPEMQLIARPHMQNVKGPMADTTWLNRLRNMVSNRVAVDLPDMEDSELTWSMKHDDMYKMSALLANCSIAMNSCSTVAIESVIVDRPTVMPMFDVNQGYSEWKSVERMGKFIHMKKFIDLGGVEIAHSFEEFDYLIKENLSNPDRLKTKRKYAGEQECFKLDGRSTKRVAAAIKSRV